jgi:hypothetical protein
VGVPLIVNVLAVVSTLADNPAGKKFVTAALVALPPRCKTVC